MRITSDIAFAVLSMMLSLSVVAQQQPGHSISEAWVSDLGDGTYKNPVLHADYSDPDVCRVGNDYFLVASSFDAVPGLPILQSNDLVNWKIIGHALLRQTPNDHFEKTQHEWCMGSINPLP